ncbi:MOSC domain-containing protein [Microcella sp.]|uniref:MOSC domain-containing protein n=1 Tax=Microcella sp. TaxID=1913979 RepID=UPI00391A8760
MSIPQSITIEHLLASPSHRYEGRPSDGAAPATAVELHDRIALRAGLGIVGDRYFGHAAHRDAAVTIMAAEALEHVAEALQLDDVPDFAATRRNIQVRGLDIDAMRGATFSIDSGEGAVLFRAMRPANPCGWMDAELAPGAHRALLRRGGMRCAVLSDGVLRLGAAVVTVH